MACLPVCLHLRAEGEGEGKVQVTGYSLGEGVRRCGQQRECGAESVSVTGSPPLPNWLCNSDC